MFKLNVPARVKAQRINICSQCKFFKEETMSCGTLMSIKGLLTGTHGGLVDPEEVPNDTVNKVKYYKKKVRLCGCPVMDKAKYAFESCPIGKWGKYRLTDEETQLLTEFVATLPSSGKLTSQQVDTVIKWFEKMTGHPVRRCDGCIRAMVKELQLQSAHAEYTQI
jgi:hypothetical protein